MARGNSRTGANPDVVLDRVRRLLHLAPTAVEPDPDLVALDAALPVDLMADPANTRAVLARFGRD